MRQRAPNGASSLRCRMCDVDLMAQAQRFCTLRLSPFWRMYRYGATPAYVPPPPGTE
jgi:hypothetical protein